MCVCSYVITSHNNYLCTNILYLAEEDYPTDPIHFTIPPGIGTFIVEVPVTDDDIDENTEEYFLGVLSFTEDSTGAVLGESVILLTIIDDDSMYVVLVWSMSCVL